MAKHATIEKHSRAQLEKRLSELRRRDAELLKEQIVLEKARIIPVAEANPRIRLMLDAQAMFDGGQPEAPSDDKANRLFQILAERKVIAQALELGGLRLTRLLHEQAAVIGKDLEIAWHKNIAETIALVQGIQTLVEGQERLRSEWCMRVGLDVTPPAYIAGQRLTASQSPLIKFIDTARRLGLTEKT